MTHLPYVAAAYAAAIAVLGGLTAWVVADIREQKRRLAELEASDIIRPHRRGNGA